MDAISLQVVVSLMSAIDPRLAQTKAAHNVAAAIVRAVDPEHPIFGDALEDAAVMATVAWEESRWQPKATRSGNNDGGKARCEFQLHHAPMSVEYDVYGCAALAYRRIRASAQVCRDAPLLFYVSGGTCAHRTGRAISNRRMAQAGRIERVVRESDGFSGCEAEGSYCVGRE